MSPPDTTLDGLLTAAQTAVDAAYALHDEYNGPLAEKPKRVAAAHSAALAAVAACEAAQSEADDPSWDKHALQARLYYLRGKAIASTEEGRLSDEAERLLADAVKLKPSLNDAWNCLGECFWERGELDTARHTFHGALEHERTCATLCHLSMLLRMSSLATGHREDSLLLESVMLAKEAARLEPSNANAWKGLGTAHLTVHLNATSAAEDLHMANRAFTQAGKLMATADTAIHAGLCMDHSVVKVLLDQHDEYFRLLTEAHTLDSTLGADEKREHGWLYVVQICDAIAAKRDAFDRGEAKHKKMINSLAELGTPTCLLSQLTLGENPGRTVMVKVVLSVPQTGMRIQTGTKMVIVADQNADLMAVTIYALRGVAPFEPGTTLELKEPSLLRIEAAKTWAASPTGDGKAMTAGFHLLRIESPSTHLKVNGHGLQPVRRR
jgi:Flp pilus assembly protein TadD